MNELQKIDSLLSRLDELNKLKFNLSDFDDVNKKLQFSIDNLRENTEELLESQILPKADLANSFSNYKI
jgi:hypothetical protein